MLRRQYSFKKLAPKQPERHGALAKQQETVYWHVGSPHPCPPVTMPLLYPNGFPVQYYSMASQPQQPLVPQQQIVSWLNAPQQFAPGLTFPAGALFGVTTPYMYGQPQMISGIQGWSAPAPFQSIPGVGPPAPKIPELNRGRLIKFPQCPQVEPQEERQEKPQESRAQGQGDVGEDHAEVAEGVTQDGAVNQGNTEPLTASELLLQDTWLDTELALQAMREHKGPRSDKELKEYRATRKRCRKLWVEVQKLWKVYKPRKKRKAKAAHEAVQEMAHEAAAVRLSDNQVGGDEQTRPEAEPEEPQRKKPKLVRFSV